MAVNSLLYALSDNQMVEMLMKTVILISYYIYGAMIILSCQMF